MDGHIGIMGLVCFKKHSSRIIYKIRTNMAGMYDALAVAVATVVLSRPAVLRRYPIND